MAEDPLALETRRRIYRAIRSRPGVSAREVQRLERLGWGETVYHLERLAEAGIVHREEGSHQDQYFAADVPLGDRRTLGLLRSPSARKVLLTLLLVPRATVPDLAKATRLSPGRLSVHLRRLLETELIRAGRSGRYRTFELTTPERVARLLVTYSEGMADEWVERLLATWSDLFRP